MTLALTVTRLVTSFSPRHSTPSVSSLTNRRISFFAFVSLLACGLMPGFAAAVPTISIKDLTEDRISAVFSGFNLNPGDNSPPDNVTGLPIPLLADVNTPEKITNPSSVSINGDTSASGVAVLLENTGMVSDLLEVTLTRKLRGPQMNIPYLEVVFTFTSDSDPGGLDLSGLGLTDEVYKKLISTGPDGGALLEDGTDQDIGSRLIDPTTGNRLTINDLMITAASDAPEPSSLLLLGLGLPVLAVRRRTAARETAGVARR